MQVQNNNADHQQHDNGRNENEHHGRARANKNVDVPTVPGRGRGVNDKLRVGDDGRPRVGPVARLVDADPKVLDVVVNFSEAKMHEGQAKLVVSAVRVLRFLLVYSTPS